MKSRFKTLLVAFVFGITALCAGLPAFVRPAQTAYAAETGSVSAKMADFSITNADFNKNAPKEGEPVSPSDWTGSYGKNFSGQELDTGLVNLNYAETSKKEWGLENVSIPSVGDNKDEKAKALLINSGVKSTVYSYSSASFTLKPNSYLHLSFVAHASVAQGQAFARLSTDELDATALPLRSDGNWITYQMIVKGHAYRSITTSLVFSLGTDVDVTDEDGNKTENVQPAQGYFFVRDIQTMLITPAEYRGLTEKHLDDDRVLFSEADVVTALPLKSDLEEHNADMWDMTGSFRRINSVGYTNTVNNVALKSPDSPFSDDNFILAASGDDNAPATASLTTKDANDPVIPRFGYLRVSMWVNTAAMTGGSVTFDAIKGKSDDDDFVSNETDETASVTTFTAQDKDSWTGNWGEAVIYVKGSAFEETSVKLKISLASVVGEVYFDALTVSYVDGKDYADNSASAQKLEMASSPVTESVPNGSFNLVGSSKEEDVLLPATDWTTDLAEYAMAGIVGLDDAYFNEAAFAAKREKAGLTEKPALPANGKLNAFAVYHPQDGASVVTSASFSAPADSSENAEASPKEYNRIVVTAANRMRTNDSVTIQLLLDGKVVAERSDLSSREFADYEFDVKINPERTYQYSLVFKIGDKNDAATRTFGSLWLSKVGVFSADAPSSAVNAKSVDLSGDLFSCVKTEGLYAENYAWDKVQNTSAAATMGFVRTDEYPDNIAAQYREMFKGATQKYGMLIHATEPSSVGYTQVFPITYKDGTYVRVTLRLKTRGFEKGEGATIRLGDKAAFSDVNTQYLKDVEVTEEILTGGEYKLHENLYSGWREYSFYINVGSADNTDTESENTESEDENGEEEEPAESTVTTSLSIMVGDSLTELRSGMILVDSIRVETIDDALYASETTALDNKDPEKDADITPSNLLRVNLRDATATKPTGSTSPNETLNMNLMLTVLGSVLAGILALFLLIVLIKWLVSRRRAKTAPAAEKVVSYDRSNVERNYASGGVYAVKTEPAEEWENEAFEIDRTPAVPSKQPKTVRQFKKLQKQKEQAKNTTRKGRRGLTAAQDQLWIEELKNPELPEDDIDDFD